jgi:hypothetical protein
MLFDQGDKEQRRLAAEARIRRNGGQILHHTRRVVVCPHPGIKMLGVIDYLRNFHGYIW